MDTRQVMHAAINSKRPPRFASALLFLTYKKITARAMITPDTSPFIPQRGWATIDTLARSSHFACIDESEENANKRAHPVEQSRRVEDKNVSSKPHRKCPKPKLKKRNRRERSHIE